MLLGSVSSAAESRHIHDSRANQSQRVAGIPKNNPSLSLAQLK